MAENMIIDSYKNGNVNIADNVIGVIASIAAAEIKGIKALSGTFSEEVMEIIGKKNLNKGVGVEVVDDVATLELSLIVDYGINIIETVEQVQENVKTAIESMTGIKVAAVNVTIEGINLKIEGK
jgi:uncharacterized alkaline shock family protein YloU